MFSRETACRTMFVSLSDFRQESLLLSREECLLRSFSLLSLPYISVSFLSTRCDTYDCCVSEWARSELLNPKQDSSRRSIEETYYCARCLRYC